MNVTLYRRVFSIIKSTSINIVYIIERYKVEFSRCYWKDNNAKEKIYVNVAENNYSCTFSLLTLTFIREKLHRETL